MFAPDADRIRWYARSTCSARSRSASGCSSSPSLAPGERRFCAPSGSAIAETDAHLCVLLADERPEEVPQWQQALPQAEIFAATADEEPREQVREAELAMGHAKRLAEAGGDVVVLIDSLSRLALGYRDPARVKRIFGVGRELGEEGTGSLTVIATVLDSDDRGAEVREAVETTENLLLRLDADLAAKGIFPSLVPQDSRASGEEQLRDPEELEKVRRLRAELAEMEPEEAARALADQIASDRQQRGAAQPDLAARRGRGRRRRCCPRRARRRARSARSRDRAGRSRRSASTRRRRCRARPP